jgi:hypothetical protein
MELFYLLTPELYIPLLHHSHIPTINTNILLVIMGVTAGKRKRRFTRSIKSSADKKDSETRREYVAAQERGESVPVSVYQPVTRPEASKPPPRTKQELLDAMECTNSALLEAEADVVEKDKCASKATKRAEDLKSVAVKSALRRRSQLNLRQ